MGTEYDEFLAYLSVGFTAIVILAISYNEYSWGRLTSRAGPNYWGMVAFMAFAFAPLMRRWWQRIVITLTVVTLLVLAQSRGSMLATIVCACIFTILAIRHAPPRQQGSYIALAFIGGLVAMLATPVILDKVFLMSDARRGISSGGTGRGAAWEEVLAAFAQHPLFGVGYRQHEQYVTAATNAHNAYLAVLAELGVVGLTVYLLLLGGAALRCLLVAWRTPRPAVTATAGFLWGYMFIGLIENQSLALGSPMPLLMLFTVAYAWTLPWNGKTPSKYSIA